MQADPGILRNEGEAISWWKWRPGIKPWRALFTGGILTLLALFLLVNGVALLAAGILDSFTPPWQVPGRVTGQSSGGAPQLTIHLEQSGLPASITLVVSAAAAAHLKNGEPVIVDYGAHLHNPYALEAARQSYALPGTGRAGHLVETLSLLIFSLLLLPYPALLGFWGWRDLHTGQRQCVAPVIALRKARQTTTRTPGMVPRTVNTWHGVAIRTEQSPQELLIFAIPQDLHARLQVGEIVEVRYSPHLHYLYTLTRHEQHDSQRRTW